ncbi:MAG: nucleoside monophosphate kinase, partial [Candidatus Omnitrophica bacterium]|nr:nucleoside monophosphate kinase [Candidatus Omnitrophota bacterium]
MAYRRLVFDILRPYVSRCPVDHSAATIELQLNTLKMQAKALLAHRENPGNEHWSKFLLAVTQYLRTDPYDFVLYLMQKDPQQALSGKAGDTPKVFLARVLANVADRLAVLIVRYRDLSNRFLYGSLKAEEKEHLFSLAANILDYAPPTEEETPVPEAFQVPSKAQIQGAAVKLEKEIWDLMARPLNEKAYGRMVLLYQQSEELRKPLKMPPESRALPAWVNIRKLLEEDDIIPALDLMLLPEAALSKTKTQKMKAVWDEAAERVIAKSDSLTKANRKKEAREILQKAERLLVSTEVYPVYQNLAQELLALINQKHPSALKAQRLLEEHAAYWSDNRIAKQFLEAMAAERPYGNMDKLPKQLAHMSGYLVGELEGLIAEYEKLYRPLSMTPESQKQFKIWQAEHPDPGDEELWEELYGLALVEEKDLPYSSRDHYEVLEKVFETHPKVLNAQTGQSEDFDEQKHGRDLGGGIYLRLMKYSMAHDSVLRLLMQGTRGPACSPDISLFLWYAHERGLIAAAEAHADINFEAIKGRNGYLSMTTGEDKQWKAGRPAVPDVLGMLYDEQAPTIEALLNSGSAYLRSIALEFIDEAVVKEETSYVREDGRRRSRLWVLLKHRKVLVYDNARWRWSFILWAPHPFKTIRQLWHQATNSLKAYGRGYRLSQDHYPGRLDLAIKSGLSKAVEGHWEFDCSAVKRSRVDGLSQVPDVLGLPYEARRLPGGRDLLAKQPLNALSTMFISQVKVFTIMGKPGGGKGELSRWIIKQLNELLPEGRGYETFVLGDYFRGIKRVKMDPASASAQDLKKYGPFVSLVTEEDLARMKERQLISDQTVINIITAVLETEPYKNAFGLFLDGFPRNLEQARLPLEKITWRGAPLAIDLYVYLDIPNEKNAVFYERASHRKAQAVLNNEKPREDDEPETVAKGLKTFDEETRPGIEYVLTQFAGKSFKMQGTTEGMREDSIAMDRVNFMAGWAEHLERHHKRPVILALPFLPAIQQVMDQGLRTSDARRNWDAIRRATNLELRWAFKRGSPMPEEEFIKAHQEVFDVGLRTWRKPRQEELEAIRLMYREACRTYDNHYWAYLGDIAPGPGLVGYLREKGGEAHKLALVEAGKIFFKFQAEAWKNRQGILALPPIPTAMSEEFRPAGLNLLAQHAQLKPQAFTQDFIHSIPSKHWQLLDIYYGLHQAPVAELRTIHKKLRSKGMAYGNFRWIAMMRRWVVKNLKKVRIGRQQLASLLKTDVKKITADMIEGLPETHKTVIRINFGIGVHRPLQKNLLQEVRKALKNEKLTIEQLDTLRQEAVERLDWAVRYGLHQKFYKNAPARLQRKAPVNNSGLEVLAYDLNISAVPLTEEVLQQRLNMIAPRAREAVVQYYCLDGRQRTLMQISRHMASKRFRDLRSNPSALTIPNLSLLVKNAVNHMRRYKGGFDWLTQELRLTPERVRSNWMKLAIHEAAALILHYGIGTPRLADDAAIAAFFERNKISGLQRTVSTHEIRHLRIKAKERLTGARPAASQTLHRYHKVLPDALAQAFASLGIKINGSSGIDHVGMIEPVRGLAMLPSADRDRVVYLSQKKIWLKYGLITGAAAGAVLAIIIGWRAAFVAGTAGFLLGLAVPLMKALPLIDRHALREEVLREYEKLTNDEIARRHGYAPGQPEYQKLVKFFDSLPYAGPDRMTLYQRTGRHFWHNIFRFLTGWGVWAMAEPSLLDKKDDPDKQKDKEKKDDENKELKDFILFLLLLIFLMALLPWLLVKHVLTVRQGKKVIVRIFRPLPALWLPFGLPVSPGPP